MKKQNAFTMAEVLITLGIIGIIVAMTLPSLVMKHRNKVFESQFKKAYSIASQALMLVKAELEVSNLKNAFAIYNAQSDEYLNSKLFTDTFYEKVKSSTQEEYKNSIRNYTLDRDFTSNAITCTPVNMLPDGSSICNKIWSNTISITIDINGPKNGPNAFGHDIFMFIVNDNDALIGQKPGVGDPDPDDKWYETNKRPCSKKYSTAGNGIGCSYYAIINKCPDDEGKNYWECLPK